jgi:uncharacterized iron-regulated protein
MIRAALNVSVLVLSAQLLVGCVANSAQGEIRQSISAKVGDSNPSLPTLYDVQIQDPSTNKTVSVDQLAQALKDADVVFIGEYHGNHGSHWLQAQLQAALHKQRPAQVLSMEQFTRDKQSVLDQYLNSEIGEVALIKQGVAWPNYKASYRPLVEFAKQHQLPVIAANAPAGVVRCIGRQGRDYLAKLDKAERQQIASQPFLNNAQYQTAFQAVMHGPAQPAKSSSKASSALSNSYLAQLSRDNTMAESILNAHQRYPKHQIIHVNGAFHSDNHLGTVALLKQRNPSLNIKVVSPVQTPDLEAKYQGKVPKKLGDYLYFVQPLPEQYANDTERDAAFKSMFSGAAKKACK